MNNLLPWQNRQIVFCLALLLSIPASEAFAEPVLLSYSAPSHETVLSGGGQNPALCLSGQNAAGIQPMQQNAPAPQQQAPTPAPVGTAAAPDEQPSGVAASKPSGAAIAPAKQKRIRTYAVRTALVVGAAVAIGVVVGASLASPARAQ